MAGATGTAGRRMAGSALAVLYVEFNYRFCRGGSLRGESGLRSTSQRGSDGASADDGKCCYSNGCCIAEVLRRTYHPRGRFQGGEGQHIDIRFATRGEHQRICFNFFY